MKPLGIYKDMTINYGELDAAMERIGFTKELIKSKDKLKEEILGRPRYFIVYSKNGEDYKFTLFAKPAKDAVANHDFAFLSYELEGYGFIKDYDDLAKMIEKNRQLQLERA